MDYNQRNIVWFFLVVRLFVCNAATDILIGCTNSQAFSSQDLSWAHSLSPHNARSTTPTITDCHGLVEMIVISPCVKNWEVIPPIYYHTILEEISSYVIVKLGMHMRKSEPFTLRLNGFDNLNCKQSTDLWLNHDPVTRSSFCVMCISHSNIDNTVITITCICHLYRFVKKKSISLTCISLNVKACIV